MLLKKILSGFNNDAYHLSHLSKLLPVIGAFFSIFLIAALSQLLLPGTASPILIASMGASAILLFVVPSSPMAQIWPFVGGHMVSAFIGIACFKLLPDLYLAAAISVSLSMLAMMYLGCLHPPGGAASLAFILGGPAVQEMGFLYLITPVAMNVVLMLAVSQLFNYARFQLKRRPKVQLASSFSLPEKSGSQKLALFSESDLDEALQEMGTFIDISHEDLNTIYALALSHSKIRQHVDKTCEDIMSEVSHTIEYGNSLEEAWSIMQDNDLYGLVVVDRGEHVVGIITMTDFIEHAEVMVGDSIESKIEALITPSRQLESNRPEAVGQIMSPRVITVNLTDKVSTVMPIFKQHEAHILPVVDGHKKLRGLIIMADL